MPLKKGSSRKVQSSNIREMVLSWRKTGRIGNSKPKTEKKAIAQAVAASYRARSAPAKRRKRTR